MRIHRYTPWDGSQQVQFPTPQDLLNQLNDTFLEEEGARRALRNLMRRGFQSEDGQRSVKGLQDLLREADQKRRELLEKYSPDSFKLSPEESEALSNKLNELAEKLEAYQEKMRSFMERLSGRYSQDMSEMAEKMQQAQERYQRLKERLGQQVDERSMGQQGNMTGPSPEGLSEMLDRLNRMLDDENFLQNLPNMLDATVDDLDNLLDNLDSMSQQELQNLSNMLSQMEQLEQLMNQYPFQGNERMGMGQAGQVLGQLKGLEQFLRWGRRGMGDVSDLDLEAIRELLGEEAYEQLKYLENVEQMMVDEGYLMRTGSGVRLSPKGMRRLGDKALKEIFQLMNKNRWGQHTSTKTGSNGSRLEESKPYEFGDPLDLDIRQTLMNAVEEGRYRNRAAHRCELLDADERRAACREEGRSRIEPSNRNEVPAGYAAPRRVPLQCEGDKGRRPALYRRHYLLHGARN